MNKIFKFFFYFYILGFVFIFSKQDVLAQSCNKVVLNGTGSGVTCTYLNPSSGCSASCASGWSTSCGSDQYISATSQVRCYINDNNCNNIATCYQCSTLSCPSGKTHQGECPTWLGYTESNCSTTYPGGNPYTCCDCNEAFGCLSNSDCDDSDPCTTDTCSGGECYNTDNGTCDITPTPTGAVYYDNGGECSYSTWENDQTMIYTRTCPSGSFIPANCQDDCYDMTGCCIDPSYPYLCANQCYSQPCTDGWCNGSAPCIEPYCYDSEFSWGINCGSTCESKRYWRYTRGVTGICCRPEYPYVCAGRCYTTEVCDYCNGPCRTEECPTTCHSDWIEKLDGNGVDGCNYKWCPPTSPINGASGVCGSSNGQVFSSTAPSSNLCSVGTASSVTLSGTSYLWSCYGLPAGNCTGSNGSTANCSAIANSPPIFNNLVIKNNNNNIVSAESGNKNQICQTTFNGSRQVIFEVSASDPDGITDIANITVTWNGITIPRISSIGATTIFGWNSSNTIPSNFNNSSIYPLVVTITDSINQSASNSSRYFKFWDCNVSISGTFYDGTNGAICPSIGFTVLSDPFVLNLNYLAFTNNGVDTSMTINSPANTYSSGSNKLIWGLPYGFSFNTGFNMPNPILRYKDSAATNWNCNGILYTEDADAYSNNPSLIADFSGVLTQYPWWQANNGGVISNRSVTGEIPVTCVEANNCIGKISINGLVAAPSISNSSNISYQNWYYGSTSGLPNNNAKLADYNTNYDYFYSQYFVKKAVGTTFSTDNQNISDIGTTGIYFVGGNLNIDTNKTLNNPNDFLMIIVKGDIFVDQDVDQVDGILVANNIGASGASSNQLIFNGSLYASNTINFSRDFSPRLTNNSTPAVVVKYDPKLIFNMPGSIAKILTNWQWGN